MALNPNFPTFEYGWGAMWDANNGDIPPDRYVDLTSRTQDNASSQRGRQYELDQVQSGTFSGTVNNADGALDPTNSAGPWSGHIAPYQPFRWRAQWPPTANLLTPAISECSGLAAGALDASVGVYPSESVSVVAATGYSGGTHVFQCNVASGTAVQTSLMSTANTAIEPGAEYSFTIHVRNVTSGSSLSVQAYVGWLGPVPDSAPVSTDFGTAVTLAGSASAGWSTATVTATAPVDVYGAFVGVANSVSPGSSSVLQASSWQFERGTPTAYVTPGTWYPIYSGYVERWPQDWSMSGSLGAVQPTAVDSFALLSQMILEDPLTAEIKSHSPRFLYRLDDPAGSESAADATGNNPAAPVKHGKYGPGSLTFGNDITSATSTGGFIGADGPVVSIDNPDPATNFVVGASFLSLDSAGIVGPVAGATGWTRMIAVRYRGPATLTTNSVFWSCFDTDRPTMHNIFQLAVGTDGYVNLVLRGPNAATSTTYESTFGSIHLTDGDWHLITVVNDLATDRLWFWVDNFVAFFNGMAASNALPVHLASDSVGNYVDVSNGGGTAFNFAGDLAFCTEFPSALSTTDVQRVWFAWKSACAGEATDTRYKRILRYAGYSGASDVSPGVTQHMGAADFASQDALSALQAVVDTEGGEHFAGTAGEIVFRPRSARYNVGTPVFVFGEDTAAGELPYEDVQFDYDPTHLGNIARVTQSETGAVFIAQDLVSQTAFFPRTLERTINDEDAGECQDASGYLVSRYSKPLLRISSLTLHPSAVPDLWPVALSLELGMRIRVIRRPLGRPPIVFDAFVENIQWSVSDQNDAFVTLQCSPADLTPYGVIQAWHTTLTVAANVGDSTITIDPAVCNTAQLQRNYPLKVGVEACFVLSTTATTITLTAPLTINHPVGEVVAEPLSDESVDPSTWDGACVFDTAAFTY